MKNSRPLAFTLIELLVVITIITILAALVLSAAGFVQQKGARDRAIAEIAALGAALEGYKADNGDYPINSNTLANSNLVNALMNGVYTINTSTQTKIYYEFKTKSMTNGNYLDPFGNYYNYIYTNGSSNNGTNNYDLWSTAGSSNNPISAWIKNW